VAYVSTYYDLYWLLDEAQRTLLLRLTPSAFDNDRASWGLAISGAYDLQGDVARARAYADSARAALEEQSAANPADGQLHALLGTALAYLGRKADAIREVERGVTLVPVATSSFNGPYMLHQHARTLLLLGEKDKALDDLETLLRIPYFVSAAWLRIDPNFASLKGNPRFEKLVAGS
jgi:tetratricopeptide (TPR) repeat protein